MRKSRCCCFRLEAGVITAAEAVEDGGEPTELAVVLSRLFALLTKGELCTVGKLPPIAQPKYLALRSLHAGSVFRKNTDTRLSDAMASNSFVAHLCMAAITRPRRALRATRCLLESALEFSMPSTACSRELRSVLPQRTSVLKPSNERMLLLATAAGCTGHGNIARSTLSMWATKAL